MAMSSQRINTFLLILLVLMLASVIAMFATVARGGPLDPTAPPASTDAVKLPGTPISSLPFAITQPGHYYLTRSVTVNGGIAIDIQANDVSLDLGGFTVSSTTSAGSYGIYLGATQSVDVRNGTVSGFQFGIQAGGATRVRLGDVYTTRNVRGIELGDFSTLTDCTSIDNSETGIYLPGNTSVVRNCVSSLNGGDGITIAGNGNTVESSQFKGSSNHVEASISGRGNTFVRNDLQDVILSGSENVVIDNVCAIFNGFIYDTGTGNVVGAPDHANVSC